MLIQSSSNGFRHSRSSDITPRDVYMRRRLLLQGLTGLAGGVLSDAVLASQAAWGARPGKLSPLPSHPGLGDGFNTMEKVTSYQDATTYNNFYEFGTDKADPAQRAGSLRISPWTLSIEGMVHKPLRLSMDELLKISPLEDRIYRLRCVEGWSMVIPWVGYSLSALLRRVEPLGSARYVEFVSLADESMPLIHTTVLDWPYTEGLRLDEAMHPLTLLGLGIYGEVLPRQNGAPVRVVVPWKYGFKSAKTIVKIRFTDRQPATAWNKAAPSEYGFYSNVNPDVDHPRWSQATERRIGEDGLFARRRKTLMFNGYESQVGQLYAGMDLRKYF